MLHHDLILLRAALICAVCSTLVGSGPAEETPTTLSAPVSWGGQVVHFEATGVGFLCPTIVTDPLVCPGSAWGEGGPLPQSLFMAPHNIYYADSCIEVWPTVDPLGQTPTPSPLNFDPFVRVTPLETGELLVDFNISPPFSFSRHRVEALATTPATNVTYGPGPDDFTIKVAQDAIPVVWTSGPDKHQVYGYVSMGDIVYRAPSAPPTSSMTMSVSAIEVLSVNEGGGARRGRAVVTVLDDLGDPVANATLSGTFSGDVTGSASAITDGSGTVTIDSSTTGSGNIHFTFCVDDVTDPGGSLTYNPAANTQTCESR